MMLWHAMVRRFLVSKAAEATPRTGQCPGCGKESPFVIITVNERRYRKHSCCGSMTPHNADTDLGSTTP